MSSKLEFTETVRQALGKTIHGQYTQERQWERLQCLLDFIPHTTYRNFSLSLKSQSYKEEPSLRSRAMLATCLSLSG